MPRRRASEPTDRARATPRPARRAPDPDSGAGRRTAILEAAQEVFLRYGFKKTSMDDLARAAGLSRQGLYLHFDTKEALFKSAFEHLLGQVEAAARAALARPGSLEDRLIAAYDASHGHVFASRSDHLDELLGTATTLIGARFEASERGFAALVADALAREGVAAAWRSAGLTAKDLADHLHAASYGIKHAVTTRAAYHARMSAAVKLVVRGAPRGSGA